MDVKRALKRTWDFLWHDDSVWSWLANIAVAFVLIKFIIYPLIGLAFGTSLPVVAVVSGSMYHGPEQGMLCGVPVQGAPDWWSTCKEWYVSRNISHAEFSSFPFSGGFAKGDIMLLRGVKPGEIHVGDILVYNAGVSYPVIHRVVRIYTQNGTTYYQTKGDHNGDSIQEYILPAGQFAYTCYQVVRGAVEPAVCGPGTKQVTRSTPGAIAVLDETHITQSQVVGVAWGRIPYVGYVKIWFVDLLQLFGLHAGSQLF